MVVDIGSSEELYRSSNDAGEEEDEQDEGKQHHDARKELPLRNVDDFDNDEDDSKSAYCDTIWHDPICDLG